MGKSQSVHQLKKVHGSTTHARKNSASFTVKHAGENSIINNSWLNTTARGQLPAVNKSRPDVSFLQEKAQLIVSENASKKMAIDSNHGALLSQSQLTSGNQGRDDYLQIALGLRQIGKSIMDMPKSIEDLRLMSREYMKGLHVVDDIQDE